MSYPGGKEGGGVAQWIINEIPPHLVYVEPFAGGAAVYRYKRPALVSVVADADWLPLKLLSATRPAGTMFVVADALRLVPRLPLPSASVVYFDPPYLRSTLAGRTRAYYSVDFTSEEDHLQLLLLARSLRCQVLISGYESQLYLAMLEGWRRKERRVRTRGGFATEVLWMNFSPAAVLHDSRYIGETRTQRQGFRRLCARWRRRFELLRPARRAAVLSILQSVSRDL